MQGTSDQFKSIMEELDKTDAMSINLIKQLLEKSTVKSDLCYILSYFSALPEGITSLKEQNVPLVTAFNNLENLVDKMKFMPGTKGKNDQEQV